MHKRFTVYFTERSANKAQKAIEEVAALHASWKAQAAFVKTLEGQLQSGKMSVSISEFSIMLKECREHSAKAESAYRAKRNSLGVDGRLRLDKLTNDEFLSKRMNAMALKQRIRDRLRQRKFELERLERQYRHTSNGEFSSIWWS